MKNKNIKNILLYISLVPYIILFFTCIYYAIIGYGYTLGNTAFGFIAILKFLGDFFSDIINIILYYPYILIFVIIWISYQIYYFITLKNKKNHTNIPILKKLNLKKNIIFNINIMLDFILCIRNIYIFL